MNENDSQILEELEKHLTSNDFKFLGNTPLKVNDVNIMDLNQMFMELPRELNNSLGDELFKPIDFNFEKYLNLPIDVDKKRVSQQIIELEIFQRAQDLLKYLKPESLENFLQNELTPILDLLKNYNEIIDRVQYELNFLFTNIV